MGKWGILCRHRTMAKVVQLIASGKEFQLLVDAA